MNHISGWLYQTRLSHPHTASQPYRSARLHDDALAGSASNFAPQLVTSEIAPKRSADRRKRQPQERQHSADAGTAAGRGTDCSRETG